VTATVTYQRTKFGEEGRLREKDQVGVKEAMFEGKVRDMEKIWRIFTKS